MKGKAGQERRQAAIKEILRTYGSIDHVDVICLGVRFKCTPEVIVEDIASLQESQKREALVQQHVLEMEQARQAEMRIARRILRSGG
jgi:hypothetical protein